MGRQPSAATGSIDYARAMFYVVAASSIVGCAFVLGLHAGSQRTWLYDYATRTYQAVAQSLTISNVVQKPVVSMSDIA